jgi:hypothetical protein
MLARSFGQPGDHLGQHSAGFRWPYGPTALITPFNFPLEIPLLQMMGALYMGNKVLYWGFPRFSNGRVRLWARGSSAHLLYSFVMIHLEGS